MARKKTDNKILGQAFELVTKHSEGTGLALKKVHKLLIKLADACVSNPDGAKEFSSDIKQTLDALRKSNLMTFEARKAAREASQIRAKTLAKFDEPKPFRRFTMEQ